MGKKKKNKNQKQLRKMRREALMEVDYDSDETFAFIAGYTEGGFPFGITHEEMAEYEAQDSYYNSVHLDSDDWFPDSFDWENYFGEFLLVVDQDLLINELNRLDNQLHCNFQCCCLFKSEM